MLLPALLPYRCYIDLILYFFHNNTGMNDSQQGSRRANSDLSNKDSRLDPPLTRPWLESLSTAELVKLADGFGIDVPSGLERVFIIKELLETAPGSGHDSEDGLETRSDFTETVALPRHYNISYVEVMIRDPLWAFVFWGIRDHDREIHENMPDFEGYCLRVIPVSEGEAGEDSFTVLVDVNDTARYLGFQQKPEAATDRCYIVKLCAIRGASELPLAVSRPFTLPRLVEARGRSNDLHQNPCIGLSGAPDFSVIKSADRADRRSGFRAKRP
jgi:hypothetical protein